MPSCSDSTEDAGEFSKFDIPNVLQKRLETRGIKRLFQVQYLTYEPISSGKDAVVLARTGTGKTLAFSLPVVAKILSNTVNRKRGRPPTVLVLAPTRELVTQIVTDFQSLCENDLVVLAIYGGVPLGPQCSALRAGVDIVVGTPGRVIDLMEKSVLTLSALSYVILDEVDRMLDMGFSKDVDSILSSLYAPGSETKPQTLLFSATMPTWISTVSKSYLSKNTVHISLVQDQEAKTSTNVTHLALQCPYRERASTISDVIRMYCPKNTSRCIVFCERKKDADELAAHASMNTDCHVFHGDIPQDKRELILQKFREGKYRTLITTNVAARGLDIQDVELVIQCHPPRDVEDYIHRSGRTGRADRMGTSIVFYTPQERHQLSVIERKADIMFRRIGPPSWQDILDGWSSEMARSFLTLPESTWSAFVPTARAMIRMFRSGKVTEENESMNGNENSLDKINTPKVGADASTTVKPMLRVLCCALARLSGKDGAVETRSLLTSHSGMTTYRLDMSRAVNRKGEAYHKLREQIPDYILDQLKNLSFIKGRQGFVFDVPSELDSEITSLWNNSASDAKLNVLRELPELEEEELQDRQFQSHRADWRGGNSRGSNRGFNGGGFRGNRGSGPRQWNNSGGLSFKRHYASSEDNGIPHKKFQSQGNSFRGQRGRASAAASRGGRIIFDE